MKSIRMKLWSWLMLLVVSVLVLLWLFQVVFLEQFYYLMHFSSVEDQVTELVKSIEEAQNLESAINNTDLLDRFEQLSESKNLGFEIIDINGNTVVQYALAMEQMFKRSLQDITLTALSGEIVKTKIAHMRFGTEYWVMAMPIHSGSKEVMGGIIITAPIESVAETTHIIKKQLIYITLILLLLASAIALLVSNQFSKPIVKISQAAKEISKGNFDVDLKIQSKDEIGQLSADISEMGQSLGQIDRLRKELIGNISHELRTPLSIIRGYAETLRDVTGDNPEKRSKQLDIIVKESDRLGHLIEDVLSMSQLESGVIALDLKCFDLVKTLGEMTNRFDVVHDIQLKCNLDAISVKADKSRIEQVLYNLIGNAVQHSESQAPVELLVTEQGQSVKVEVKDYGHGISAEDLPFIWDRFYQSKNAETGKPSGTGLGLAIVKAILVTHQATYGAKSEIGKGSTFWFTLTKC